ncbi:MAG: hypothetical protein D6754_00060 [Alphaproteobacteria bacterium]|nr:MAG: hypothetical protein D6754_00060 [Alphaproteobacteria bacterium]
MLRVAFVLFFLFAAGRMAVAGCPPLPDRTAEHDALFAELAASRDVHAARRVVARIWQFWTTAPDEMAQNMLDLGIQQLRYGQYDGAERTFGRLIDYCPDFAEGWNQRAFARFLAGRLQGSMEDIDEVLRREPMHFGALSGKVRILLMQGRVLAARGVLREALKIHPFLSERHLLEKPGEDI